MHDIFSIEVVGTRTSFALSFIVEKGEEVIPGCGLMRGSFDSSEETGMMKNGGIIKLGREKSLTNGSKLSMPFWRSGRCRGGYAWGVAIQLHDMVANGERLTHGKVE